MKNDNIDGLLSYFKQRSVLPVEINSLLEKAGATPISQKTKLYDLLLRPNITIGAMCETLPDVREQADKVDQSRVEEILEEAEIVVKYGGYIDRERLIANKTNRLEYVNIPQEIHYDDIQSLSTEARQKLKKHLPQTIGQASRIPGVSPSDINVLIVMLGR